MVGDGGDSHEPAGAETVDGLNGNGFGEASGESGASGVVHFVWGEYGADADVADERWVDL